MLSEAAESPDRHILLAAGERRIAVVEGDTIRTAWAAAQRVIPQLGVSPAPTFLLAEGTAPNAFAFYHQNRPHIAANIGMVGLLGNDEAAWAALWGHELAHLSERHRDTRSERRASSQRAGELLGLALVVAGLPIGDMLAEGAATLVERGYTRDEERDADRLGLAAMRRAGYDPAGAIRMLEKLAAAGGNGPTFLSTHPGGTERVEAVRAHVRELEATRQE